MKPTSGPTREQWLSAMCLYDSPAQDAMTIRAWAKKLGMSRTACAVTDWIRTGLEHGWLERAITEIEELTLRRRRVVGFRLVEQTAGK